jgi:hypothetical protein
LHDYHILMFRVYICIWETGLLAPRKSFRSTGGAASARLYPLARAHVIHQVLVDLRGEFAARFEKRSEERQWYRMAKNPEKPAPNYP